MSEKLNWVTSVVRFDGFRADTPMGEVDVRLRPAAGRMKTWTARLAGKLLADWPVDDERITVEECIAIINAAAQEIEE
jgi:hypothetical protein